MPGFFACSDLDQSEPILPELSVTPEPTAAATMLFSSLQRAQLGRLNCAVSLCSRCCIAAAFSAGRLLKYHDPGFEPLRSTGLEQLELISLPCGRWPNVHHHGCDGRNAQMVAAVVRTVKFRLVWHAISIEIDAIIPTSNEDNPLRSIRCEAHDGPTRRTDASLGSCRGRVGCPDATWGGQGCCGPIPDRGGSN